MAALDLGVTASTQRRPVYRVAQLRSLGTGLLCNLVGVASSRWSKTMVMCRTPETLDRAQNRKHFRGMRIRQFWCSFRGLTEQMCDHNRNLEQQSASCAML